MEELIAFIEARLAEDESMAKAASAGPWRVDDETYAEVIYAADDSSVVAGGRWGGEASVFETNEDARHIVRHDPARVLREVEAKRRLVHRYDEIARLVLPYYPSDRDQGYAEALAEAVRGMAAAWSDHPDYRAEWQPT